MKKIFAIGLLSILLVQCGQQNQGNFDAISEEIAPNNQEYKIDPTKDTLIDCEKGTLIYLPANSIVLENGKTPSEIISINIKEYYSIKDLISRDLVTMSDSSILVSGGMIDISAEFNGEKCYIRNDRPYTLFFPKEQSANEKMQLFYNQKTEGNEINWIKTPEQVFDFQKNKVVPYEEDDLLSCSVGWSEMIGIIRSGDNENVNEPDISEFLKYTYVNFVITSEIKEYLCENQDEYIGLWIDLDESASIKKVGVLGDSTPFHNFACSFFDTITRSFDQNGPFDPISVNIHLSSNLESTNSDYTYGFNEKYSEFRYSAMKNVNRAELNYYVMNSISFGLINCDYFFEDEAEKIDFVVNSDLEENSKVYLAFENINSMMIERIGTDGQFVFKNVPSGKSAKIICINCSEDEPKMAIESVTIDESGISLKNFNSFTLEELNEKLAKL